MKDISAAKRKIVSFSAFDEVTECWVWNKSLKNGYGQLSWNGKNTYAHRLSFLAFNGEISAGGLICHKCNNRKCVNPSHLYCGDKKSNALDMIKNGDGRNGFGKYEDKPLRKFISPTGEIVEARNISAFCRDNDLIRGNIASIIKGKRKKHRGWRMLDE